MWLSLLIAVLVGCGASKEEEEALEKAYGDELADFKEKVIRSDQDYREQKKSKQEEDLLETLDKSVEVTEEEQEEAEDEINDRLITVSAEFLEEMTPTSVRLLVNGEVQVFRGSEQQVSNLNDYEAKYIYVEYVEDKDGRKVIRRFGSAETSKPDWEEEEDLIEVDE